VKFLQLLATITAVSACAGSGVVIEQPNASAASAATCPARDGASQLQWHMVEPSDAPEMARWCRAVGAPLIVVNAAAAAPPALDEFVTLSWNAHLAEGQLPALIEELKAGTFTDGRPVRHFALLIQELYRRGDQVPAFDPRDRSAFAINPRDPAAADVEDYAAALGLSLLYVPSMRNGAELREDRGNAILSTEPLHDALAIELPLARQRRVAVGAGVDVMTADGVQRLELLNAHLEPLSAPSTLWVFKNPRGRQVRGILDHLDAPRYQRQGVAGVVLGGDFNTVLGGDREDGYRHARAWSTSLREEDRRRTHVMGRLDYLFFRLDDGWSASTRRLDRKFGSDHHPILGRVTRH
jgi:endonuclease/exonuclease/phosphatase family metal-dependent hydrolase